MTSKNPRLENYTTQDINLCIAIDEAYAATIENELSGEFLDALKKMTRVALINIGNITTPRPSKNFGLLISICHQPLLENPLSQGLRESSFTSLTLEWDEQTPIAGIKNTILNLARGFCLDGLIGVDLADLRTVANTGKRISCYKLVIEQDRIKESINEQLDITARELPTAKGVVTLINLNNIISVTQFQDIGNSIAEAFPETTIHCFAAPYPVDNEPVEPSIELLISHN